MARPEKREEVGIGANLRVKLDSHDLDVVSSAGANEFVIRIVDVTLRVSDLRLQYPKNSLKRKLHSPETACSELSKLVSGIIGLVQIRIEGRVGCDTSHSLQLFGLGTNSGTGIRVN